MTRTVMRQLWAVNSRIVPWFWGVVLLSLAVVGAILGAAHVAGLNLWPGYVLTPCKYFLLVVATHAAAVQLPIHVGHGVTRRQYSFGAATFLGVAAAGFAAATVASFAFGAFGKVIGGGTVGAVPVGEAPSLFVEAIVLYAAYICSGWLFGGLYYRLSGWVRVAVIPLGALPGLAADFMLPFDQSGVGLDDFVGFSGFYFVTALGVSVVIVAAAAYVGFLVVRNLAIRKVSG
jgi:hypothetical protein